MPSTRKLARALRRARGCAMPQRRPGAARRRSRGVIDEVPAGRLYKDGALLVDAQARTVADRRRLSLCRRRLGRARAHRQRRARRRSVGRPDRHSGARPRGRARWRRDAPYDAVARRRSKRSPKRAPARSATRLAEACRARGARRDRTSAGARSRSCYVHRAGCVRYWLGVGRFARAPDAGAVT